MSARLVAELAGFSATTAPAESTNRARNGPSSSSMQARPRRASTSAIADFPAPAQLVISIALIGAHHRPAPEAAQRVSDPTRAQADRTFTGFGSVDALLVPRRPLTAAVTATASHNHTMRLTMPAHRREAGASDLGLSLN